MTLQPIADYLKNKGLLETGKENFDGLPIRPSKRNTRFSIDNEYLEKGYSGFFPKSVLAVYSVLAKYARHKTQMCFPSITTIMKQGGIKNRNIVVNALKILEAYYLIAVIHSKGKVSNKYALLDHYVWKEPNSISIDTIIKPKNGNGTVFKKDLQQYQNSPPKSIHTDTRNQLNKSDNEIKDKIPHEGGDVETQPQLPSGSCLGNYFTPEQISTAMKILIRNSDKRSFTSGEIIKILKGQGFKPIKDLPPWLE